MSCRRFDFSRFRNVSSAGITSLRERSPNRHVQTRPRRRNRERNHRKALSDLVIFSQIKALHGLGPEGSDAAAPQAWQLPGLAHTCAQLCRPSRSLQVSRDPHLWAVSLASLNEQVWTGPVRGAHDRHAPAHHPTLATATCDGVPSVRTVALPFCLRTKPPGPAPSLECLPR